MGLLETGVTKATEKVNDVTETISDLISSKRQFVIKQITNVFLLLVILIVFGCFDFMHFKFHYEYLLNPDYWINIGVKTVADICSYNIGVNFIIDDVIKRNKTLQKLKTLYEKLNAVKQEDFPEFINYYNKQQKKIAYKNYINRKIYLLNKHAKKSDRVNYSLNPTACSSRYYNKRLSLEKMKTDEFIDANIDSLEAPYKDIDVAVFELEINGTEKIVQNKVTGSLTKGRAIASISTMLGVVIFSIIFNPIGLDPNKEEFEDGVVAAVNYAIKIASDIGIIIWQFTRGIFGTQRIVSNQLTVPLAERVKILKLYYEWRKQKGKALPKCYIDSLQEKNDNDEEYVEITMDELKQIREKEKEVD